MCDEFHPYRPLSFRVIRSNRHGHKNYFFATFFIGTWAKEDLQQPEPQRSVSALTAQHCSLLCPVISCLMWLGCPFTTFSVELLQTHEPLLTRAPLGYSAERAPLGGGGQILPPCLTPELIDAARRARRRSKALNEKIPMHIKNVL